MILEDIKVNVKRIWHILIIHLFSSTALIYYGHLGKCPHLDLFQGQKIEKDLEGS